MQSLTPQSLRTVFDRYGPRTNRRDVGAGYVAAVAAVVAALSYVAAVWAVDAGVVDGSPYFAALELHWAVYFATRGLPFAIPAAFVVGVVGWRLLPVRGTLSGVLTGGIGAVATYLVGFALLVPYFTLAGIAAGEGTAPFALVDGIEVAGLFVSVGFVLTWWLTVPTGCLAGAIYAERRETN